jgi:hypothetical protein
VSESIFSGADHRLRCHWLRANWSNRIWAKEQVTEGAPQQVGDPPARKMVGAEHRWTLNFLKKTLSKSRASP